jgi:hypothetical protein
MASADSASGTSFVSCYDPAAHEADEPTFVDA